MGDTYVDPWQEYRNISSKGKKRFMRKPNLSQAAREFLAFADRLREEDCVPYAGVCAVAVARVQHQAGQLAGEIGALEQAARFFAQAETEKTQLGLPGFGENLTSAIHCYGHAIKSLHDNKFGSLAGALSIELALKLFRLDHYHEAMEHFERGARLLDNEPSGKQLALEYLARTQAETGLWTQALLSIDELWTYVLKLHGETSVQAPARTLAKCEMATVLLLLNISALPDQMTGRQSHVLSMYTEAGEGGPVQESNVTETDWLWLSSFVQSYRWEDAEGADKVLARWLPNVDPLVALLAFQLVEKLYSAKKT